jgi:hypothetical protein
MQAQKCTTQKLECKIPFCLVLNAMKSIKCNSLYASLLSIEMKEFKAKIEKNMKQKESPNKDALTSLI